MTEIRSTALIALGGNLTSHVGEPADTLSAAINALRDSNLVIRDISRFFSTPCFPPGAGPDYVNAAIRVETDMTADALLQVLHKVEHRFGRARAQRWGMRTLDLDLLALGDLVLPDLAAQTAWRDLPPDDQRQRVPDQLILPHPRIQDRSFVLVPLRDIAPDWRHPALQRSVREMCAALPEEDVASVAAL